MNRTLLIYAGIVLSVIASGIGLVYIPDAQLFGLEPVALASGELRPVAPAGEVAIGRGVYIDLGCIYCHSQQVRPAGFGADLDRGWGTRRSVARDYIYDEPHLLGTMRTGPDLASVGVRIPDRSWHYQHLFDPQSTSAGSIMPPFPFLFETRRLEPGQQLPFNAIAMPEGTIEAGHYLVATDRGRALVAYLLSLDQSYPVPEAQP